MFVPSILSTFVLALATPIASAQCLEWDTGVPPAALGANGAIREAIVWDDGNGPALYVGGEFSSIGGVPARKIAKWDGTTWSGLGSGLTGSFASCIRMMSWTIGGEPVLVVGGYFERAGGLLANSVAVWDGTQWSALGDGFDSTGAVWDLELFDSGSGPELHAGTGSSFSGTTSVNGVARWDGSQWQGLGVGITGGGRRVYSLAVYDEGSGPRLFAGGDFTDAGGQFVGCLARWDGATWSSAGGIRTTISFDAALDLEVYDDGTGERLYVCGSFGIPLSGSGWSIHCLLGWDGTSFQLFNSTTPHWLAGQAFGMDVLDDGTGPALFVGGNLTLPGNPSPNHVVRWDGTSFTRLGTGIPGAQASIAQVTALADPDGGADDLWVVGTFTQAGNVATTNIARWRGCNGPGEMLCAGDAQSTTPCPCANSGATSHGCENSASTGGALLSSSGATSPDTVVLTSQGEVGPALTIFLQGDVLGAPTSFGDGLRCAGGNLKRLYVKNAVQGLASAPEAGDPGILVQSAALGDPIAPGSMRVYQAYYRDPDLAFCPEGSGGNTWNVSNAVRIDW